MKTLFLRDLILVSELQSQDRGRVISATNMLKIQRSAIGKVVFTLSGRIEAEDVAELQRLFDLEPVDRHLALNLKDVTLVDRDAVKFLARCEAKFIQLENCPPYIREWIEREKDRTSRRTQVNAQRRSEHRQNK